jgi:NAD(P)-dependent dehydrogenase (short-subunit alcohol dehydrogenase family)
MALFGSRYWRIADVAIAQVTNRTGSVMKTVFINGGTGTIGSQLVRSFADSGYSVAFSYNRHEAQARDLAAQYNLAIYAIDFLSEWTPPAETPDILINNAGINLSGHTLEHTSDLEVGQSSQVNLIAPLRFARQYSPKMIENGYGRIININSLYGLSAPALRLSYSASKFALRAMTMTLAQELAPFGITVNDICPGPVDSDMLRGMGAEAVAAGRYADLRQYLRAVADDVPIKRLISAEDIAAVALFLASDQASACTGQAICVDGGLLNR